MQYVGTVRVRDQWQIKDALTLVTAYYYTYPHMLRDGQTLPVAQS